MSTPSTGDASSPRRRDLRDSTAFRVGALLLVLGVAFLAARSCGASGQDVSSSEAVELAEQRADLDPERVQVRFVRQGVPPRGYWAVSLYTLDRDGRPERVEVFLVDAETGDVRRP